MDRIRSTSSVARDETEPSKIDRSTRVVVDRPSTARARSRDDANAEIDVDIDADRSKSIVRAELEKMASNVMRRSTKRERVSRVTRVMMLVACVSVSMFVVGARAGCEYYTNCGACVADTNCGWCGNDPHSQGGYGDVNKGDHVDHLSEDNVLVGGSGQFTVSSGEVTGTNTRFTQQFHGGTTGAKFYIPSATTAYDVTRVNSDTSIELGTNPTDVSTAESFGIAARLGTGTIKAAATDTSCLLYTSPSPRD